MIGERKPIKGLWCPKCKSGITKGGMSRGVARFHCDRSKDSECGWHGTIPGGNLEAVKSNGIDRSSSFALRKQINSKKTKRLVITSAQNATPVKDEFLASLLQYCKAHDAQLIVVPFRYKNPTSTWTKSAEHDDWWDEKLRPYLMDYRININKNLMLLADIKTQPTAQSPLSGFETISGSKSAIIGHPKVELLTVPTPQNTIAKILTTTGSVTIKNYIPSKAGKRGEFHHSFAAVSVEVDRDRFAVRQLIAENDGTFMDLMWRYTPDSFEEVENPVEALVMGDSHIEFIDPGVVKATFTDNNSIINTLKPLKLVWHDVHDSYAINHHERKDVFVNYVKHHSGSGNVEKYLDKTFKFIDDVTMLGTQNIFVPSNHPNDHLLRWVKETDPRTDPENSVFWAKTFQVVCAGARMTERGARYPDPFVYWAKQKLKTVSSARFLDYDESCVIKGVEVGFHGHQGPNGSRGTRKGFGKVGVKTIIGHAHSPGIWEGCYQVGTSSRLRLSYNHGPSSWLHCHALIYKNGKRSLIFIIDGEWRLDHNTKTKGKKS